MSEGGLGLGGRVDWTSSLPGHATHKLDKLVTRQTKLKLVPEKNIKLEKAAIFLGLTVPNASEFSI